MATTMNAAITVATLEIIDDRRLGKVTHFCLSGPQDLKDYLDDKLFHNGAIIKWKPGNIEGIIRKPVGDELDVYTFLSLIEKGFGKVVLETSVGPSNCPYYIFRREQQLPPEPTEEEVPNKKETKEKEKKKKKKKKLKLSKKKKKEAEEEEDDGDTVSLSSVLNQLQQQQRQLKEPDLDVEDMATFSSLLKSSKLQRLEQEKEAKKKKKKKNLFKKEEEEAQEEEEEEDYKDGRSVSSILRKLQAQEQHEHDLEEEDIAYLERILKSPKFQQLEQEQLEQEQFPFLVTKKAGAAKKKSVSIVTPKEEDYIEFEYLNSNT